MIKRELKSMLTSRMYTSKALIVLGPRQTGKTTLLTEISEKEGVFLFLNCDDPHIRASLENISTTALQQLIGNNKLVFIDEAQRVKNIGISLKLITDQFKDVQLLVSGSSALELANEINEPLTGRKFEYILYPISYQELLNHTNYIKAIQQLEQRMIFGMYPEIINNPGNEVELLKQISDSYLYKDLLSYKGIRKPDILRKLLVALSLQVGSEVSYNELSIILQVDKSTISSYIDLLEKAFVIFKLQPLSRNSRNEISKSKKIYFYDNGIRNILINNTNRLEYRNDTGALWENFLISERMKFNQYNLHYCNNYFWRTHQQKEIDYIEEYDGKLFAYKFKWKAKKSPKLPADFYKNYKNTSFSIITKDNFLEFLQNK